MKALIRRWFLVGIVVSFSSFVQAAPEAAGSQVTLDWTQFLKLWEDAHRRPPPPPPAGPPVDFVVSGAEYMGLVVAGATEMSATLDLTILAKDRWVNVPFLPATVGLKTVKLDGAPVPVGNQNGFHTVILKGAGHHQLTAVFSVPTPREEDALLFTIPVARTAMTLISLNFPKAGLEVEVQGAQAVTTAQDAGHTRVRAILSPTDAITVSWKKQIHTESLPTKIHSHIQTLLTVEDLTLKSTSVLSYSILHTGVRELRLAIPEGFVPVSIEGDGLDTWTTEETKGGVIAHMVFNQKMKGDVTLTVNAERSLENASQILIPLFKTIEAAHEETALAIETKSGVEVTIGETKNLRQVDVKELPGDLWSMAENPLLFGFLSSGAEARLEVSLERHEDVPVLTSTIDSANALTVLIKDGQWITRVSYDVRNSLKQFLTVKLPEGAHVWSALVAGKPVKPSVGKSGTILIPLEKSDPTNVEASFPVEIVYHVTGSPWSTVGRRAFELPEVDLPASQALWSVYLPDDYLFPSFGGNMEQNRWASLPTSLLVGRKNTVDGLFDKYRSRDEKVAEAEKNIENDIRRGMGENAPASKSVLKQAAFEVDSLASTSQHALGNHTLPIAFRIPEAGQLFRFGKIMVTTGAPSITVTYVRAWYVSVARGFSLLSLCALTFRYRRSFGQRLRPLFSRLNDTLKRTFMAYSRNE